MADFYCDISAVGNGYQAYADTPVTWGVPQDGNGLAAHANSAAVAIATINCASASASGAGSISLLGVTVSSTLTGSGSALATSIVTAINAASGAVTGTFSANLLPLNRLVWARVNPGLNTEVQIMLRIAGVDWNGMLPVSGGTWATAPTMGAFAGGANGPYAYLMNGAPMGTVFGRAARVYGLLRAAAPGVSNPGAADVIHCRTRRSGANLTFTDTWSAYTEANFVNDRNYVFDDGTIWAGDDGQLTLSVWSTGGTASALVYRFGAGSQYIARKKYGFRILARPHVVSNVLNMRSNYASNKFQRLENVLFEEDAAAVGPISGVENTFNGQNYGTNFVECKFIYRLGARPLVGTSGTTSPPLHRFINCDFDYFNLAAPIGNLLEFNNAVDRGTGEIAFIGCRFNDVTGAGTYKVVSPISTPNNVPNGLRIVFDSCVGISDQISAGFSAGESINKQLIYTSVGENRPYRFECPAWMTEWRPGLPTLAGELPSGAKWATRVAWYTAAQPNNPQRPVKMSKFVRAGSGSKRVVVQMLMSDTIAPTKAQLGFVVDYTDTNDVPRNEVFIQSSLRTLLGTATTHDASAAVWAMNGLTGFSPRKQEMLLGFPVKTGTEVCVTMLLAGTPASGTSIYVDHEWELQDV